MKRAAILILALASLVGCSRRNTETQQRCPGLDAGTPVDPLLLAFLSRARSAHHLADDHESAGDLAAAAAPLATLVAGPLPHGSGGPGLGPEVREVLADTHARLADLRSRLGDFEQALADVQAGLSQAREPNYFRGHLLETEGLVEERHAKALEARQPEVAAALRKRAITLLEQAMAVQSGVIEAGAGGAPQPENAATSAPPAASTR